MPGDSTAGDDALRESRVAELALIEAETQAEGELQRAEARYRRALDKLTRAQERLDATRREFEQARAQLDQRQLERAAGPVIRRVSVARPSLPRPARDDSRARERERKRNGPAPEEAGPEPNESD
ncbi:MAG TPA: hypothetical protein VFP05_10915 [Thermomicrobiales bacterium]|nr:hypothetical protein [Thermomicrobiales bacterium]